MTTLTTVTRTEQIHIGYDENISSMCHTAKNLWNEALYDTRQVYFNNQNKTTIKRTIPSYNNLAGKFKTSTNYKQLYSSTAQYVLRYLADSWTSFFKSIRKYNEDPSEFLGRPNIPGYKKKDGEFTILFTNQACVINSYQNFARGEGENNPYLRSIKHKYGKICEGENYLIFPEKSGILPVKTRLPVGTDLREVRVVPQGDGYNIEIVYDKKIEQLTMNKSRIVGIDYGISNIVAIANNIGEQTIVIKGSIVKSINQWYNKRRAELYSIYDRQPIACDLKTRKLIFNRDTEKLQNLTSYRNRIMTDIMHKISRYIINYCIEHNIGTIVIGHNAKWKQNINLGKITNQNFVMIPYHLLTRDLEYKGNEVGIDVIEYNEAHTSKCSFLDNESVEHHDRYVGKRIKRGLFRSALGKVINADVHAGSNLIRKVFPNVSWKLDTDGIAGTLTCPLRLSIKDLLNKKVSI